MPPSGWSGRVDGGFLPFLPSGAMLVKTFTSHPGPTGPPSLTSRSVTASRKISPSTVRRLSLYLRALEELAAGGTDSVSSGGLARAAGTSAAQVRKDLSSFGSFGTRGLGYPVPSLIQGLRRILGLSRPWTVVLVGAGRIGSALHAYPHFAERGFRIVAVLDHDPVKVGREWDGTRIRPMEELEATVAGEGVEMAILAVPGAAAQGVTDRLVAAGVRAILNFAPVRLEVPSTVVVNDVNLALEMEALSFALAQRPGARSRGRSSGGGDRGGEGGGEGGGEPGGGSRDPRGGREGSA
jgi:redox-sensing transcriptional repressor